MSGKDFTNPFHEKRLNQSLNESLLSYGDQTFSMYKMLKKNSRLSQSSVSQSQKEMEEKILQKYEKQFYELDQSGHSLAQELITQEILKQKPNTDDFWYKVQTLSKNRNKNPFSKITVKDELQTASHLTNTSYMRQSTRSGLTESRKLDRRNKCHEAMKIRHFIEAKKAQQVQKKVESSGFSLLTMYKKQGESKKQYPKSIILNHQQYFRVPLE